MRFVVLVHPGDRKSYESGKMPDGKLVDLMTKFNEELVDAGVMLSGEGLYPSSGAVRIRFSGDGKKSVSDGPFTESQELIGGFWIWQVKSKEEAIEWAKRAPMEEGATLEIRQCFEPEDFGPEIAQRERAMMEKIEGRQKD